VDVRPSHLLVGALAIVFTVAALRTKQGKASESAVADPSQAPPPPLRFARTLDENRFFRGNIHAHSARTDGDSPAAAVFAWYRAHGYHFLALTDHNRRLDPSRFAHAETEDFRLLAGEEVTMVTKGEPVHVNALCTRSTIGGANFESAASAMQWAIDSIAAQGGVALINHPNFHWAVNSDDLKRLRGVHLLDVYNGHPFVRSYGDAKHPSVETMWSAVLKGGGTMAPAAVDDMHMLRDRPTPRVAESRPGTGWVEVMATELSRPALCKALAAGNLYASNGPRLKRLRITDDTVTLWLDDPDAHVEFFGADGVLASPSLMVDDDDGLYAEYRLRGDEAFVRARITSVDGRAWTNAYRTTR
jgi:hypothetical protein